MLTFHFAIHYVIADTNQEVNFTKAQMFPLWKMQHSQGFFVISDILLLQRVSILKPYRSDQSHKLNTDVPSLYANVRISD